MAAVVVASPATSTAVGDRLTDALTSTDGTQRTRALVRLRKLLVASARLRPSATAATATSETAIAATLPLALVQRVCDEYERLDDMHARAVTLRALAAELSADVRAAAPLAVRASDFS